MIHAWLDGALSPDESARMESHANSCADCAALVAEARGLVAASSRILASLDAVPAGVIPGSSTGTDQLAALRARRAADSRRWWRDRRFVAAASLILVAGISSVVWRTAGNQSPAMMEFTRAVDSVSPPAAAPSPGPVEAKAEASQPLRDAAPVRAATRPADSTPGNAKVAATSPVSAAAEVTVESRAAGAPGQQTKDAANTARAEQSAKVQLQVQQQDAAGARRLTLEPRPQRADSTRPVTPPPTVAAPAPTGAALARNRSAADASLGAGFQLADVKSPAGSCYEVRPLNASGEGPGLTADTVRLLDEVAPERSDPAWFVATRAGALSGAMRWRLVDSITVELRTSNAANAELWRFHTRTRVLYQGGGQVVVTIVPDVQGLRNVRAMWATPLGCR